MNCVQGVLDKFSQIQPKMMFSVSAVIYNGKLHSHLDKLKQVVEGEFAASSVSACCFELLTFYL